MQRVVVPELLDTDSGTAEEVARSVSDLGRINRWFGGNSTTLSLVRRVAIESGCSAVSLLEVAAGSGEVPEAARRQLRRQGITLDVTLLDRACSHLRQARPQGAGKLRAVVGDALRLPFPASSFDMVASSLFAHHLEREQLVEFVDESLRVARIAVVINDLVRHPLHLLLAYAGLPLFRSRLTRHDALASVRRAYTREELAEILPQTKAKRIEIASHYLFRLGVVAWKQ
jgi:ubiquinone/menaquinone biosynthesis C-methylase UbiE